MSIPYLTCTVLSLLVCRVEHQRKAQEKKNVKWPPLSPGADFARQLCFRFFTRHAQRTKPKRDHPQGYASLGM